MQKPYCTVHKWLTLIGLASVSWTCALGATTWNAANTSAASVQSAINSASDGDTVIVPSGASTWSTQVSCSKSIDIIGAGVGQTIITSSLAGKPILTLGAGSNHLSLSGFTFVDSSSGYVFGIVAITGSNWRVHHCKFDALVGSGLMCWTDKGLVDHCTFTDISNGTGIFMSGNSAANWSNAAIFGTADFVYIEDCTFNFPVNIAANGAIDAINSAKYVFRHNTVSNVTVGHHGLDSGNYRSTYAYEVYNNTITTTVHRLLLQTRGGTGVYYNNTCTDSSGNITTGIELDAYREQPERFPAGFFGNWGAATGINHIDGNLAGVAETGTPYVGYAYPLCDQIGRTGPTTFGA